MIDAAPRVTSTNYSKPYRPLPIALVNRVASPLGQLGLRADLSEAGLLRTARRRARLDDFGDEAFRAPLRVLLDSIEGEARLNPVGRVMFRENLVRVLVNRLRLTAGLRRAAELRRPPLFIVGLQRTGTTVLHRLLACDPYFRHLPSWEAMHPAPMGTRNGRPDPRLRAGRFSERAMAYLAPDFFAIHPVEVEQPEEDVLLLDLSLYGTTPVALLRVPSFAAWLEQQDHVPAYRLYERVLRFLVAERPAERWLLKTPHHMEHLDALLEVFPGALIVQTHRDPAKVTASFCSMIAHGRGLFTDDVDPREVGAEWLARQHRMVTLAMKERDRAPSQFLDVHYQHLMADPIGEVRRVYELMGEPLRPEAEARMRRWLEENRQHKYGKHSYRLEDFGLDRPTVDERFAAYRERFGVEQE